MDRYDRMLAEVHAELHAETEAEAARFLATLDPTSAEGLWFEAIASSFPSRLAAAAAYVRDVGPRET